MAYAGAIGGAISGAATAYSAYLAAEQAEAERKQKKDIWNKDTKLKISQFNMNQNRLSGLAGIASGRAKEYLDKMGMKPGDEGYADARAQATADSKSYYQGKGDYSTLNTGDYTINSSGGGGSRPGWQTALDPAGFFDNGGNGETVAPVNDFSGGGSAYGGTTVADYNIGSNAASGRFDPSQGRVTYLDEAVNPADVSNTPSTLMGPQASAGLGNLDIRSAGDPVTVKDPATGGIIAAPTASGLGGPIKAPLVPLAVPAKAPTAPAVMSTQAAAKQPTV